MQILPFSFSYIAENYYFVDIGLQKEIGWLTRKYWGKKVHFKDSTKKWLNEKRTQDLSNCPHLVIYYWNLKEFVLPYICVLHFLLFFFLFTCMSVWFLCLFYFQIALACQTNFTHLIEWRQVSFPPVIQHYLIPILLMVISLNFSSQFLSYEIYSLL